MSVGKAKSLVDTTARLVAHNIARQGLIEEMTLSVIDEVTPVVHAMEGPDKRSMLSSCLSVWAALSGVDRLLYSDIEKEPVIRNLLQCSDVKEFNIIMRALKGFEEIIHTGVRGRAMHTAVYRLNPLEEESNGEDADERQEDGGPEGA